MKNFFFTSLADFFARHFSLNVSWGMLWLYTLRRDRRQCTTCDANDDSESDKNLNFLLCLKLPLPPKKRRKTFFLCREANRKFVVAAFKCEKTSAAVCFICDAGHEAFATCLCCFIFIDFEYSRVRERIMCRRK